MHVKLALQFSLKNEGPLGMFSSGKLSSQIIRDVPYAILTLLSYEIIQGYLHARGKRTQSEAATDSQSSSSTAASSPAVKAALSQKWQDALAGSIAGGIGSFLTNPMDVVKTRLMTTAAAPEGAVAGSVVGTVTSIIRDEGLPTFFIGSIPRLMHKIPANGLFFLCYEAFKAMLGVERSATVIANAPRQKSSTQNVNSSKNSQKTTSSDSRS